MAILRCRAIHQPKHQLMGHQLKAVRLSGGVREIQLTGGHLQGSTATLPAELKRMALRPLPWANTPKPAQKEGLQSRTKILLSRQAAAAGREQGQEGSIGHESGHRRAVPPKDGPS